MDQALECLPPEQRPPDRLFVERLPSQLLPGQSFPRAPVRAVGYTELRESTPIPRGKMRSIPRGPPQADVVSYGSFPPPRTKGASADHGSTCPRGYSKCGIVGRGKLRPIC